MRETSWWLTVEGGLHERRSCPLVMSVPKGFPILSSVGLVESAGQSAIPGQMVSCGQERSLVTILPYAAKGSRVRFRVVEGWEASIQHAARMDETEERLVRATVAGDEVFTYDATGKVSRPFFSPLRAPGGPSVTRGLAEVEVKDHIHHRSVWVAHGDVNGENNWSDEPGHGTTVCEKVEGIFSGPCVSGFETRSRWVGRAGDPILSERLTVRVYAGMDLFRLVDVAVGLEALDRDVVFGDTKEGGILSVRVAPSMEVRAGKGGRILNAHAGVDEGETWGKPAAWCHYGGPVNGALAGIGLMDHPGNLRHPTPWHVRDYGLMTANPFGLSHFDPARCQKGDWTLKAKESAVFRYRMIVHRGSPADVGMADRYFDWVAPAGAVLTQGD